MNNRIIIRSEAENDLQEVYNYRQVKHVCGGALSARADDQDENAIKKRHDIYYDKKTGTLASVIFFKELSKNNKGVPAIIELDGTSDIKTVSDKLMGQLK